MDRIKRLKDLIPKLKANKKIHPLKIESLEWELKYLESEKKQLSICGVVGQSEQFVLHSTDWNGKCFKCGEQVFVREEK